MSSRNQSTPPRRPAREQKGYQPRPAAPTHRPNPQGGHQPSTGQDSPSSPPSNPPNQGSGGKK